MKLSIITVNFNNKIGLEKTMASVFAQTFTDYEYIVIDGGSTDGSKELIEKHADKLAYWVSEPDKGVFHAMNKGIARAKGEYLQFLNSGDWLIDDKVLEKIFDRTEPCDMIYGNCRMIMPDNSVRVERVKENPLSFKTFIKSTINHQSAFIAKELFDRYGMYDEHLKVASDWKFFLIAIGLHHAHTVYKDVDVVYYPRNGLSVIHKDVLLRERESVLKEWVPETIQSYFKQNEDAFIRASIIQKHVITRKLYRLSEILVIRLSRFLDLFTDER